jgi:hypothetical protein
MAVIMKLPGNDEENTDDYDRIARIVAAKVTLA